MQLEVRRWARSDRHAFLKGLGQGCLSGYTTARACRASIARPRHRRIVYAYCRAARRTAVCSTRLRGGTRNGVVAWSALIQIGGTRGRVRVHGPAGGAQQARARAPEWQCRTAKVEQVVLVSCVCSTFSYCIHYSNLTPPLILRVFLYLFTEYQDNRGLHARVVLVSSVCLTFSYCIHNSNLTPPVDPTSFQYGAAVPLA